MSDLARNGAPVSGRRRLLTWSAVGGVILLAVAWGFTPRADHENTMILSRSQWQESRPYKSPSSAPAGPPALQTVAASAPLAALPVQAPPHAPPAPIIHRTKLLGFYEAPEASGSAARAGAAAPANAAQPSDGLDAAQPRPEASDYAKRMQTTQFADTRPVPPHFHKRYTIAEGATFLCDPIEPISSELPGGLTCITREPVRAMDSTMDMDSIPLLPVGTKVHGQAEHGLGLGEDRLFVVWTRAQLPEPDGRVIPLDSPAGDAMGQTGVPGEIRDHLWQKLKATLAVSAIQLVSSVATAVATRGNNNTYLGSGSSFGVPTLAQQAFAHDLNIPTTLYHGPEDGPVTVKINRMIDLVCYYGTPAECRS